jgi:plasmid stabilization system protein ParE
MTKIIISPRADADLDDVTTYLAGRGGEPLVAKYFGLFDAVYRRLQMWPASEPARRPLGKQARIAPVPPFVLIYDWDQATDTVTIVRIVRGSRRITRKLVRV